MRWSRLAVSGFGCLVYLFLLTPSVMGVDVPVIFQLDNILSEFTVDIDVDGGIFGSDSDSDSSTISGTVDALLSIDTSAGTPRITGIEFTGWRFVVDDSLEYHLSLGIFGPNADATVDDVAGFSDTPIPPAPVTSLGLPDLNFEFDASHHEFILNEGIVTYDAGVFGGGTVDFAAEPAGGSPPEGTIGTIALTEGATNGNLTDFAALVDIPVVFSEVISESGFDITFGVDGRLVADGTFSVDTSLAGVPGDLDGDGDVDGDDFLVWQSNFGGPGPNGDANGDGIVDGDDFLIWQSNFGTAGGEGAAIIPEPTSMIVLLVGAIVLGARRRRGWSLSL